MCDVAAATAANVAFDQLNQLSMSPQLNEDHLKSLGLLTHYGK